MGGRERLGGTWEWFQRPYSQTGLATRVCLPLACGCLPAAVASTGSAQPNLGRIAGSVQETLVFPWCDPARRELGVLFFSLLVSF